MLRNGVFEIGPRLLATMSVLFARPFAKIVFRVVQISTKQMAACSTFFAITIFASVANADVIEISPEGSLTVYGVPSVFTTEGVRPITPSQGVRPMPAMHLHSAQHDAIDSLLTVAADRYAIRTDLLQAVAWRESNFHPEAVSSKGAVGIMQLMEGTARDLGVNRYDLSDNILGGAAYLRQMLDRYRGNEALALAAYNAGPGAVDRSGGIPRFMETQQYVSTILGGLPPIQDHLSFVTFIDR